MPTFHSADLASGLALLAVAFAVGRWLMLLARRNPRNPLVNEGVLADMVCVGEVALLVGGIGLLIRSFADML